MPLKQAWCRSGFRKNAQPGQTPSSSAARHFLPQLSFLQHIGRQPQERRPSVTHTKITRPVRANPRRFPPTRRVRGYSPRRRTGSARCDARPCLQRLAADRCELGTACPSRSDLYGSIARDDSSNRLIAISSPTICFWSGTSKNRTILLVFNAASLWSSSAQHKKTYPGNSGSVDFHRRRPLRRVASYIGRKYAPPETRMSRAKLFSCLGLTCATHHVPGASSRRTPTGQSIERFSSVRNITPFQKKPRSNASGPSMCR